MRCNSRSRYNYSLLDFLFNILWPLKCIKLKFLKNLDTLSNRYLLYSAGEHKLAKELNVVSFIKMQRQLKTVVRLIMTRQQRILSDYNKLNKINVYSNSSSVSITDDMCIPKMLDNSKIKQHHKEVVGNFFDEYLHQKHTTNDCKLMHAVYSSKELADINFDDSNNYDNNHDQLLNSKHNCQQYNDQKELHKSLSCTCIPTVNLVHKHEEEKIISPKSSISVMRLVQENKNDDIQYFDEIDCADQH